MFAIAKKKELKDTMDLPASLSVARTSPDPFPAKTDSAPGPVLVERALRASAGECS